MIVKKSQVEWKGALLSTQNMGKGLHKVFKYVVNEISQALPILRQYGSEVSYLVPEPRNVAKLTILSEEIKKPLIKATVK